MANTGNTYSDTKSTCDMLEVSPSAHQPSSSIYSANAEPQAQKKSGGKSATEGKESNLGVARKKASKAPGAF
jgi:hypothetical protein